MLWVVPTLLAVAWLAARHIERKEWNDGICRQSGKPWQAFATDSSGATGYSQCSKLT